MSLIKIHEKMKLPYGAYIEASESLKEENLERKQYRMGCFVENLGRRFHREFGRIIEKPYKPTDCELFAPEESFPDHYDEGGESFIVCFHQNCTLTVKGHTITLDPWRVYSFEEGMMHNSTGMLFMCKPSVTV